MTGSVWCAEAPEEAVRVLRFVKFINQFQPAWQQRFVMRLYGV